MHAWPASSVSLARLGSGAVAGIALAALAALAPAPASADEAAVQVLVLKEHGVGSAAQAQPYVDRLVAHTAKRNGWAAGKGRYHTDRNAAEAFIQEQRPRYGILSLGAFLGLRARHGLEVLGQVSAARAGGQQYHLVSQSAADLAGCKGKRLASDHAGDARFVEGVVAGGKFKLGDFTLVKTTRPVQTLKKVISGDAECALVDDAQLAELAHLKGADGVRSVWKSAKLPPMVIVAFPAAPAAERKALQESLKTLCDADGKAACAEAGIDTIRAASAADVQKLVDAYGK